MDPVEALLVLVVPAPAVAADAVVADPALLVGLIAASPALDPVGVDTHELILVGDLGRPRVLVDGRAPGRQDRQPPSEPVQLGVVGVAVQDQIEVGSEDALQVVGVLEVLVVRHDTTNQVVVDHADPQPAPLLEHPQPVGEPAELGLANPAVVVLVAVALGHGRVQPRHHQPQVGQLEQRPRLVDVEGDRLLAGVEAVEHRLEVLPLRPERRHRLLLARLAVGEIGLARGAADVVVARHHQHPPPRQVQGRRQLLEELPHLLELRRPCPLGEVPGDHHQVRPEPARLRQAPQVLVQPREQRVHVLVADGQAAAAEQVVVAELRVGQMQDGDRLAGHHAPLVPSVRCRTIAILDQPGGPGKPGRMCWHPPQLAARRPDRHADRPRPRAGRAAQAARRREGVPLTWRARGGSWRGCGSRPPRRTSGTTRSGRAG